MGGGGPFGLRGSSCLPPLPKTDYVWPAVGTGVAGGAWDGGCGATPGGVAARRWVASAGVGAVARPVGLVGPGRPSVRSGRLRVRAALPEAAWGTGHWPVLPPWRPPLGRLRHVGGVELVLFMNNLLLFCVYCAYTIHVTDTDISRDDRCHCRVFHS